MKYVIEFDLPDNDTVLNNIKTALVGWNVWGYSGSAQAKPKQSERKKGKWIWASSTYDRTPCEMRYMCSECHHETILHSNEASYPWEKFCPNCGCSMEER